MIHQIVIIILIRCYIMSEELRNKFEDLIDEMYNLKFKVISDYADIERRVVRFRRVSVYVTLILTHEISFDVYAFLTEGIYELGETHLLTTRMLEVKKICFAFDAREMNTTERLYPENRRGKNTKTSGL